MKRFLLFIVISVAIVSLGLTIYYFSTNNEVIVLHNPEGRVINVGDKISAEEIIDVKNPSEYTKIEFTSSNTDLLVYDSSREGFYAQSVGGETEIVVTTSNRNYSKLTMTVTIRDGSEAYPFQIGSAQELSEIGSEGSIYTLDKHYELADDIYVGNLGANFRWSPIGYNGTSASAFVGEFNGNGHTIYNLYITNVYGSDAEEAPTETPEETPTETPTETPAESASEGTSAEAPEEETPTEPAEPTGEGYNADYNTNKFVSGAGLFYEIGKSGYVHDLTIAKANIQGAFQTAGVVAGTNKGTIKNVDVYDEAGTDFIIGEKVNSYIGGIVGINEGKIYWCSSDTAVISGLDISNDATLGLYGGGIAGKNVSEIYECYFKGVMTRNGSKSTFGGIVGLNDNYNDGSNVTKSLLCDCYAVIKAHSAPSTSLGGNFGGIVGSNNNFSETNINNVSGCYFAINDTLASQTDKPAKWIANNIVDGKEVAVAATNFVSIAQLADSETFVRVKYASGEKEYWNWNVWKFTIRNDGHPVIDRTNTITSTFTQEVTIDSTNAQTITNAKEFIDALNAPNVTYTLTKDIDFSTYTDTYRNFKDNMWYAIENFSGVITCAGVDVDDDGVMDRDYAIISNLTIYNKEAGQNVGLLKTWTKGIIQNVSFENITFQGERVTYAGVLAGIGSEVTVSNVSFKNVTFAIPGVSSSFGTAFGSYGTKDSSNATGQIEGITVDGVNTAENSFLVNAGGVVGVNYKKITAIRIGQIIKQRTSVTNIGINGETKSGFMAKSFGGVVGQNYGCVERTDVSKIYYNASYTNCPDLYLDAYFIDANSLDFYVGSIAAYSRTGASIQYCTVDNCELNAERAKEASHAVVYMGGVAGSTRGSSISQIAVNNTSLVTTAEANVESKLYNAPSVGGIVGNARKGSALSNVRFSSSSSINTPNTIDGCAYVGGIIGEVNSGVTVAKSEAAGNMIGFYVGGFAGITSNGSTFSKCAATGSEIKGSNIAGLAAMVRYEAGVSNITFDNCYTKYTLNGEGNGTTASAAGFVLNFVVLNKSYSYDVIAPISTVMSSCYTAVNYAGSGNKYAVASWDGGRSTYFIKRDIDIFGLFTINTETNRTYELIMGKNSFYEYRNGLAQRDTDVSEIKTKNDRKKAFVEENFQSAIWNIAVQDGGLSLKYLTIAG